MRLQRLPDSLPAGIDVFLLGLDPDAAVAEADWSLLSREEGGQALRLRRHADRVRFVGTRAALRRLIGQRLGRSPRELEFGVGRQGKPRLVARCLDEPAPEFNVSHAGDFALIAVAERAVVGIDIERRDETLDVHGLQSHALSPLELSLPAGQRVDFFDCWTAKEAVLKALGLGVTEHLQQLSILMPQADATRYRLRHDAMAWPALAAQRLTPPAGYAASLAWWPRPV